MAFNPQDYDVKPIGAAGLTERTSLDGSERILVQAGADVDVNTTPMQFFKYQVIKSKIDEIKEDISSLELSLEGVNTSLSSHDSSISGLNTAVGEIEGALDSVQDTLDSVQGTLDGVQGSISGLNTAVGEIEDTLDSVQGSVSGVEMMNINASEADTYSIGNTHRFLNIVGKNIYCDKLINASSQDFVHSERNFLSGTFVQTSIDYSHTDGAPWVLEIKGNMYAGGRPLFAIIQGYIYNNTIISTNSAKIGSFVASIIALNIGGNLCFWWPRQEYWCGYAVRAYVAFPNDIGNRVTSITDSGDPGGTKRVSIGITQG